MTSSVVTSWFAIRVKSNREKITSLSLTGKGYETFLPECRRSNERGFAESPLFPGYLFCRFDIHDRLPVLTIPGVVHIVGIGKQPVPVDEAELESLKIVVRAGLPVQREESLGVGQPIQIEKGPLAGAAGVVVGVGNQRLVVAISLLQRSVSVELKRDWISAQRVPAAAAM